jgi:hypothetical protein
MSSRKVTEYLIAEVLVDPVAEEDARSRLPPLAAHAPWADDFWCSSVEEEVVESNLLCSHLYLLSIVATPVGTSNRSNFLIWMVQH